MLSYTMYCKYCEAHSNSSRQIAVKVPDIILTMVSIDKNYFIMITNVEKSIVHTQRKVSFCQTSHIVIFITQIINIVTHLSLKQKEKDKKQCESHRFQMFFLRTIYFMFHNDKRKT
jgi:hypothetical protein